MVNAADLRLVRETRQPRRSTRARTRGRGRTVFPRRGVASRFRCHFCAGDWHCVIARRPRRTGWVAWRDKTTDSSATAPCRRKSVFVPIFDMRRHPSNRRRNKDTFAEKFFQTCSSTGFVRENWSRSARNSCRHDSSVFSRRAKPMMRNVGGICLSLARW